MPFCNLSQELSETRFTLVENAFIRDFLPDAPPKCVQVYLYGLYLCGVTAAGINTLDAAAVALNMPHDEILTAFTYWEETGLVHIIGKHPFEVVYLPINSMSLLKKIKPGKYAKFNKEIQNILNSRMISPNEFNEYYLFLEMSNFQPEALVRVAEYCADLKGADINYPYILTVARNLSASGIKTLEKVDEKLDSHDRFNDDLKMIYKALRIKRNPDFEDRRLCEKWLNGFGFTLDTVIHAAKQTKGGMAKLDASLERCYRLKLFSAKEIDAYESERAKMFELAAELNKIMGLYYSSLDYIVEDYVSQWIKDGFDADALKLIAKYCFIHNFKRFDDLSHTVQKFYKLGLITEKSIRRYTDASVAQDALVKEMLDACGLDRFVAAADRNAYNNWTNNWGFDKDVILYAASLAKEAVNPIAFINKTLSSYKTSGIKTLEQAKASGDRPLQSDTKKNAFLEHEQRNYTNEQLNALFFNLDGINLDE